MTVVAVTAVDHPDTKPIDIPRVPVRSLAARRQDAVDELHALAGQLDASHPLFDDIALIIRKRGELAAMEFAFYAKAEALARRTTGGN